jgi:hypothetical protein
MLYYESIVSEERYTGKPHFDVTDYSSPARNFWESCTKYRAETARDCSTFVVVTQPAAGSDDRLRRPLGMAPFLFRLQSQQSLVLCRRHRYFVPQHDVRILTIF